MLSFSSMSNSLSHSAANTMRPTKVRASVGIEHVGVLGEADAEVALCLCRAGQREGGAQ